MNKKSIMIVAIVSLIIILLIFIVVNKDNNGISISEKMLSEQKNNVISGAKPKNRKIKRTDQKVFLKETEFTDSETAINIDAKEIILNSADEPHKVEAPEIRLDEDDNPIVDAKGNPIANGDK